MNRHVVGYPLLTAAVIFAAAYSAAQVMGRGFVEAGTPKQLTIQLPLDPGERLSRAAVGDLTGNLLEPALVFGSLLPGGQSRVRVLHRRMDHYETAWTYTSEQESVSLMIEYTHDLNRRDLIALWTSGSGRYLDVQVFEWNGRTYREIWHLAPSGNNGQLTGRAWLTVQQIDQHGNVGLVVRAPIASSGEDTRGALPHQVTIYRWDVRKQTFVLFKRFVDPAKTFE